MSQTLENQLSFEKLENLVQAIDKTTIKMPCGYRFHWYNEETALAHRTPRATEHLEDCLGCKIALGKSKANVLDQDTVANLFTVGIDGKKSHKGNLRSESGILTHYRTIEAIRLETGEVIENTQCWSSGFASCPHHHADYSLPLSTIANNLGSGWDNQPLRKMKIIDRKGSEILFELDAMYFLYGFDENKPFLCEIQRGNGSEVSTVKDAYDAIIPIAVHEAEKNGLKIERQGDLFFVAQPKKFVPERIIENRHNSYWLPWPRALGTGIDRYDSETRDQLIKMFESWQHSDYSKRYDAMVDFVKDLKPQKDTHIPKILNTRHNVNHIGLVIGRGENYPYVTGIVRHEGRQHAILNLKDSWYAVHKNNAVRSWQVPPRETERGRMD